MVLVIVTALRKVSPPELYGPSYCYCLKEGLPPGLDGPVIATALKKFSFSVFVTLFVTFVFLATAGIKDFVPMPVDDTYEGFGELTERANMWLSEQSEDVRVTNMMSVMVQKDEGGWSVEGVVC